MTIADGEEKEEGQQGHAKGPPKKQKRVQKQCPICNRISKGVCTSFVNEVYPIMQVDDISRIAKGDPLIVQFMNGVMSKNIGNSYMYAQILHVILGHTACLT